MQKMMNLAGLMSISIPLFMTALQSSSSFESFNTPFTCGSSMNVSLLALSVWVVMTMFLASMKYGYVLTNTNNFKASLLALLLILMAFFTTDSYLVMYLFFELSLAPTFYLIMKWGYQPERLQASVYFIMYTVCASLPLLIMIFMMKADLKSVNMSLTTQSLSTSSIYLLSMTLAFLAKIPMWGVHLWLPKAHVEAPVSGSMMLAGVLLKLGGYGLMKIMNIAFSSVSPLLNWIFSINLWSALLVGIICTSLVDIKSLIAYSSIVHMALMILGILSGSIIGWAGAFLMMISHGFSSPGMFAMANTNYEATHSRNILLHKGVNSFNFFWFALLAANMAAPPSLNFGGEVLLYLAMLKVSVWCLVIIGVSSLFAGAYNLYLYSSFQSSKKSNSDMCNSNKLLMLSNVLPIFITFTIMTVLF